MKKILAIFFALALSFALAACGRNKNKATTPATTAPMMTTTDFTTTRRSEITTDRTASTTERTTPHPTETSGSTAPQSSQSGVMPGESSTAPTGTAPGGSTSVR